MVGFPTTIDIVNSKAGQIALALRETFSEVANFKAWLDGQNDAALTALGFSSADMTTLRAAYTDLNALRLVATAQGTQAQVNDFFFNAKKLLGIN